MGCMRCSRGNQRKKQLLRVLFDVVCIILVSSGIFAIKYGTKPYHRGFFCDDESIKHPVLKDTISVTLDGCVGVLLPLAVIVLMEFLMRNSRTVGIISLRSYSLRQQSWILEAYNAAAAFIFGVAVTQFLTETGKFSVGRLRPHFLTLCNPDFTKVNCSAGYITDDVCTSTDTEMMTEARLSFPSGHSSFSMYCMLYLILYLQARVSCQAVLLLIPVIQLLLFSMGFYTCLSRISDYKHHWSDVLGGAILGILVCVCVVWALTNFGKVLCGRQSSGILEDDALVPSREQTAEETLEGRYNSHGVMAKPVSFTEDHIQVVNMQQVEF